jgi:hypothetical protein
MLDYCEHTGDAKFIERGLKPIARIYRDDFINDDGSLNLDRDPFTREVTSPEPGQTKLPQHAYNDDFGASMMLAASRLFNDDSYMNKAALFARWLVRHQGEDGGYEGGEIPSAVPVTEMIFRDYGTLMDDQVLLSAADKTLEKLVGMQFTDTGDPRIDGGFLGVYEGTEPKRAGRMCVNMRASAYALIALLKAESDLADIWLGIHNKPFRDQRWVGTHDLIW